MDNRAADTEATLAHLNARLGLPAVEVPLARPDHLVGLVSPGQHPKADSEFEKAQKKKSYQKILAVVLLRDLPDLLARLGSPVAQAILDPLDRPAKSLEVKFSKIKIFEIKIIFRWRTPWSAWPARSTRWSG